MVPLSQPAIQLLQTLPRIGSPARLLFTTNGITPFSGVSKSIASLRRRVDTDRSAPWRLHDIRRTFASGCARLGVPVYVVEKCLNHSSGTFAGIVGVYQRHEFLEERRDAMELWANHVIGLTLTERRSCSPAGW